MQFTRRQYLALSSSVVLAGLSLSTPALADDAPVSDASEGLPLNADPDGIYTFLPDDCEDAAAQELSGDAGVATFSADTVSPKIVELWGQTRYETSQKEALCAYASCGRAIVASGIDFPDSLCGAALAGGLDCPVVLTEADRLSSSAKQTLDSLGAKEIYVLGGKSAIADSVYSALAQRGSVRRLSGATRYETQQAVYDFGKSKGLWSSDVAIVASGANFPDALSVSPVAFALKAPIFFVNESGELPSAQLASLRELAPKTILVVGGPAVVSDSVVSAAKQITSAKGGSAVRLYGQTRYETSLAVARHAVENLGFSWDGLAFASGKLAFDALGGAVVQGKAKSVLLLVDDGSVGSASGVPQGAIKSQLKFLGGGAVLSGTTRAQCCAAVGVTYTGSMIPYTSYRNYNISLDHMVKLQAARGDHSYNEYYDHVDPSSYQWRQKNYLMFALLDEGHSGLTASQLDSYIASCCGGWESSYGWNSTFRGMGQAFVNAAKQAGVNEAYLLAHAALESAWGCSYFAHGWSPDSDGQYVVKGKVFKYYKGTTYYNFFGIGAYDSNPSTGAHIMSIKEGWTTPEATIIGSAKWLSSNYIRRRYKQNTLYLERFDCAGSEAENDAWHEYCTSLTEMENIAITMYYMYEDSGIDPFNGALHFEVPVYVG